MDGFTYFLNDPKTFRIKIGKTQRSVGQRLCDLNSERTLAPTEYREIHSVESSDCHGLEMILQDVFSAQHLRGEWYELDLPDIILLSKLTTEIAERMLEHGRMDHGKFMEFVNGKLEEKVESLPPKVKTSGRKERLEKKIERRIQSAKLGFSDGSGLKRQRNTRVASHVREQIEKVRGVNLNELRNS